MAESRAFYYETPWLIKSRGFWSNDAFGFDYLSVCKRGVSKNWKIGKAKRIKLCFSSAPVDGAMRARRNRQNVPLRIWIHLSRYGVIEDQGSPFSPATFWWWVEVDV